MGFLVLIIVGAAAGFLATRIMDIDLGVPQTIALGILGAIIGGFVLRLLLSFAGAAAGFIGAVLGAVFLLWAFKKFSSKN